MPTMACPTCRRTWRMVGTADDEVAEAECVGCFQRRLDAWRTGGRVGPDPRNVLVAEPHKDEVLLFCDECDYEVPTGEGLRPFDACPECPLNQCDKCGRCGDGKLRLAFDDQGKPVAADGQPKEPSRERA